MILLKVPIFMSYRLSYKISIFSYMTRMRLLKKKKIIATRKMDTRGINLFFSVIYIKFKLTYGLILALIEMIKRRMNGDGNFVCQDSIYCMSCFEKNMLHYSLFRWMVSNVCFFL